MYQRRTKSTPLPLRIPTVGVLLLGLYACTQNLPLGLLFVAVTGILLTLHDGVEIDFSAQRIKLYWSLAGLKFGSWEALPAPERLTLVPVRNTYTVYGSRTGSSINYQSRAFEVHLYPEGSRDHYVVSVGTYEEAKADVQILSRHFQVVAEDFAASQ